MADNESHSPEEILNEILAGLQSEDGPVILHAISRLDSLTYSSDSIRRRLENLAISHVNADVRKGAGRALNLKTNRFVRSRLNKLSLNERSNILNEIRDWEQSNLLGKDIAAVIRRRYDFDIEPALEYAPLAVEAPATREAKETARIPESESASTESQTQSSDQPSGVIQTLLSETSIKIFLYLGAFFVVSAAAILAALIETARLPILLAATIAFGIGSIAIKRRLPQPGFALFVVFSFLMPIDAGVIADQLALRGDTLSMYWAIAMFVMAIVWGFGTIFYNSRFFSVACLLAFEGGSLYFLRAIADELESGLLGMTLAASIAGLGIPWFLKKWRDEKFALPAFLFGQLLMLIIVPLLFGVNVSRYYSVETTFFPVWLYWIFAAAAWIVISTFYILSDELYPLVLFQWPAAWVLVLMPWLIFQAFKISAYPPYVYAFSFWGVAYAVLGEWTRESQSARLQKYHYAILFGMLFPFAAAFSWGIAQSQTYAFGVSLFISATLAVISVRKIRVFFWSLALIMAQVAYFMFFNLPFMEKSAVYSGFQLLGATLLLLLPDLFLKKDFKADPAWRMPVRIFGALNFLVGILNLSAEYDGSTGRAAMAFGAYALFFLIYALAYSSAWIGIVFTSLASASILFLLHFLGRDLWLPMLSTLGALYFLVGFVLRQKGSWGNMFRYSALGLGTILSIAATAQDKEFGGWYIGFFTLLFIVEMYIQKQDLFEAGVLFLSLASLYMILHQFKVTEFAYFALAISLFWLGLDALLYKTFSGQRLLAWATRAAGGLLAVGNAIYLLQKGIDEPRVSLTCFGLYALFLLVYTLLYSQPVLGYSVTLFLALTLLYALRTYGWTEWFLPMTALSVIYYGIGFFYRLRSPNEEHKDINWAFVLWTSGIGVGLLASILAPIKGGLSAAVPSAVTATMFAVEAFKRRNAWLALPANLLYVLSYFVILSELNVNEPQLYSVGAAALGMFQHYLLTRSGSKTGTFIMGMLSQFVLLGTTYIEMVDKNQLSYFFVLFFESIVVIFYGIIIRSRSLAFVPIGIVVIGVVTVLYSALKGLSTVLLVGCVGIIFIFLGIGAVLLRERISKLGERLSDWQA